MAESAMPAVERSGPESHGYNEVLQLLKPVVDIGHLPGMLFLQVLKLLQNLLVL